jgi:hypothetical protein
VIRSPLFRALSKIFPPGLGDPLTASSCALSKIFPFGLGDPLTVSSCVQSKIFLLGLGDPLTAPSWLCPRSLPWDWVIRSPLLLARCPKFHFHFLFH